VLDARERRRRNRLGCEDTGLPRDVLGDLLRSAVGADGALPVERYAADRSARHRPQRVTYKEQHRCEEGHRSRERDCAKRSARRRAEQPDKR